MEEGDDAYALLGLSKDATSSEIKKSYHKLALKYHPDRQNTDEDRARAQARFSKIAGAYEILSDEDKRKEYDACSRGYDSNKVHVDFNDPYEVFKRAFKKQWGMEYPGAEYDYSEEPIQDSKRLTNGDQKTEKKLITNGKDKKHKDVEDSNKSSKPVSSNTSSPKSRALVVSKKNGPANQQLVVSRDPHDNRPKSINTKTKEIKHKDGVVETVTETTIERPDGSTETMRSTDKGDKRPEWKKPKEHKLLTNGERTNTPHASSGKPKKQLLCITNGSAKEPAPEAPRSKRRGRFGRK